MDAEIIGADHSSLHVRFIFNLRLADSDENRNSVITFSENLRYGLTDENRNCD